MAILKTGWLTDINNNNFAPKTAAQSVFLANGTNIEQNVNTLNNNVETMQEDISILNNDVETIQEDISTLNSDLEETNTNVSALNNFFVDRSLKVDQIRNSNNVAMLGIGATLNYESRIEEWEHENTDETAEIAYYVFRRVILNAQGDGTYDDINEFPHHSFTYSVNYVNINDETSVQTQSFTAAFPAKERTITVTVPLIVRTDNIAYLLDTNSVSFIENQSLNFSSLKVVSYKDFIPLTDEQYNLGYWDKKWKDIYCVNGTINTSDKNEKKSIQPINSKYFQLFDKLKPVSYQFNNGTRTHLGLVAQEVKQAMDEISIDSNDFAAYCSWRKEDGTEGCGLRYEEFIALCIAEIQELKERIRVLEKEKNNK